MNTRDQIAEVFRDIVVQDNGYLSTDTLYTAADALLASFEILPRGDVTPPPNEAILRKLIYGACEEWMNYYDGPGDRLGFDIEVHLDEWTRPEFDYLMSIVADHDQEATDRES